MSQLTLSVTDVATGGDGIARADDGRVVFVDGGIPGDRVTVDVVKDAARSMHAVVADVQVPSVDRVTPSCPHVAAGCGGCGWQHVDLDAQRRGKVRMAEESLRRIGRVDGSVEVGAPLPASGFRTSIRVLLGPDGPAFRAASSHRRVPVDSCEVAHPALAELLDGDVLGTEGEVTLRVGGATGERLALYAPSVPDDARLPADVTAVGTDDLGRGASVHLHDVVAGERFRISPQSFFQTRTDGAEALVAQVRIAAGDRLGAGHLVDLYGGVGLFARTLGVGMRVTLVESAPSSVADARHNLADRDATVVAADVARWRPVPADLVIADPPRAGLGRAGVDVVAATGAERVVLVSCDAASFGRDAGLLAAAGYHLDRTVLVDLFPQTPHVELVSRLSRSPVVDAEPPS